MGTDVKLSSEFTIIYGGEVIAYCTDFTLERNKEVIDITKLGDTWRNKKVDIKGFSASFNGMITRGDTVTASLWDSTTAYTIGQYVVIAGKAWEAQGSTTGDNPTTDDGTNWLETSGWLVGTTYDAGDLVYITSFADENRIYKSLQGSNLGNDPLTETAYWERLETNYESLLNELKHNDTIVKCAIKPTITGETYYAGDCVISSLSASIGVADKVSFSGTLEGSGELSGYGGYGPELHTSANAASDPNGNEADAITGWGSSNLTGTGANVFESQASVKDIGSYALHSDANDTPTSNALFSYGFTVESGETYLFKASWRHIGAGGGWRLSIDGNTVDIITSSDVIFQDVELEFIASTTIINCLVQENSSSNNGGVYLDNVSLKKIL